MPNKVLADHADGKTKEKPKALQNAVWGLLDGQGVALIAIESEADRLKQLAPGIRPDLSQPERAKLIVRQHLMSIDMAYRGFIAQAWPNGNEDASIGKATNDLLERVKPVIEECRKSNQDVYGKLIAATDERIEKYQKDLVLRPRSREIKETLEKEKNIRERYVKVLEANGGKAASPPRQGRTRRPVERYAPYPDPKEWKGKRKGTGTGTQPGPMEMEMDIDSEGVDLGDRTGQEAAETEEDAVEAESRKQPLASQIELAENGEIVGFESAGRSPSPFASQGMGAHTTAWTVHLDVIRAAILRKTVPGAITNLKTLSKEAQETSNKMTKAGFVLDERHKERLAGSLKQLTADLEAADKASPQAKPILLQHAINSLLTYVNYIPGATTIEAADTGAKNEGRIRNKLLAHESGEKTLGQVELRANLLGLLDVRAVTDKNQRLTLLKNHLKLVAHAYPKSWQASGLRDSDLKEVLREWETTSSSKTSGEQEFK